MKNNIKKFRGKLKEYQLYYLNAPMIIYLSLILVGPILWGVGLSFTDKSIGGPANFSGFANFTTLLKDAEYLRSILNTGVYTIFSLLGKIVLGTLMALSLNRDFKGRNFVRALLMIPWALPNIVVVLNWKWIFTAKGGIANHLLKTMGLINSDVVWFGSSFLSMLIIILANIWRGTPFFGISILAKLQTIPKDYYEAADVDGATTLQKFFKITLPQIKDVIMLSTLMSAIWTINEFETVWLLTGGGPGGSTQVMNVYSYKTAMTRMQLGRGMAVSVLALPVFVFIISRLAKSMIGAEESE